MITVAASSAAFPESETGEPSTVARISVRGVPLYAYPSAAVYAHTSHASICSGFQPFSTATMQLAKAPAYSSTYRVYPDAGACLNRFPFQSRSGLSQVLRNNMDGELKPAIRPPPKSRTWRLPIRDWALYPVS